MMILFEILFIDVFKLLSIVCKFVILEFIVFNEVVVDNSKSVNSVRTMFYLISIVLVVVPVSVS